VTSRLIPVDSRSASSGDDWCRARRVDQRAATVALTANRWSSQRTNKSCSAGITSRGLARYFPISFHDSSHRSSETILLTVFNYSRASSPSAPWPRRPVHVHVHIMTIVTNTALDLHSTAFTPHLSFPSIPPLVAPPSAHLPIIFSCGHHHLGPAPCRDASPVPPTSAQLHSVNDMVLHTFGSLLCGNGTRSGVSKIIIVCPYSLSPPYPRFMTLYPNISLGVSDPG
jgi:hypothetical protein